MSDEPNEIIDGLGGTTAVARLLNAPMSTVHSWRKNGIPPSRLAHLKLAAQVEGLEWPSAASQHGSSPDSETKIIGEAA